MKDGRVVIPKKTVTSLRAEAKRTKKRLSRSKVKSISRQRTKVDTRFPRTRFRFELKQFTEDGEYEGYWTGSHAEDGYKSISYMMQRSGYPEALELAEWEGSWTYHVYNKHTKKVIEVKRHEVQRDSLN